MEAQHSFREFQNLTCFGFNKHPLAGCWIARNMAPHRLEHHGDESARRSELRFGKRRFGLPRSRLLRIALGVLLIIGGVLGFLPILGFWMIPLGLLVLSHDLPGVRRWRRKMVVRLGQHWRSRSKRF